MATFSFVAPGHRPFSVFQAIGTGATYTADVSGVVSGVVLADVASFMNAGWPMLNTAPEPSPTTGLVPIRLPLMQGRNSDGSALGAAAAAGKFGNAITLGTSQQLVSEAANSNTKTDIVLYEFQLPKEYIAAANLTVTCGCQYNLGSGTIGTHTLAAAAYRNADAGTQGANMIATSAQSVPATEGDVAFTVTGTTLSPGDRVTLSLTMVIQDTGASNITGNVDSVRVN